MNVVRSAWSFVGLAGLSVSLASIAWAQDAGAPGDPTAFLATPSARAQQTAVDAYLASATEDASLVGGPCDAGYDGGFWIRGGAFLLKVNLTVQARYEAFLWNEKADEPAPGGDLSGWSVPRVTLRFSGDASCCVHYYAQLEFGHAAEVMPMMEGPPAPMPMPMPGMIEFMFDPGICREAWIEYEACPAFAVRMGLLQTANTRQLMTPPEEQQFVDVSLAATSVGAMMPGWTDRNRDYGIAAHGVLGCRGQFSYLATITNGDGAAKRNVLDGMTNDNLAYSGRVNWNVLGDMGYEECALRQNCGQWYLALGAWAHDYTNIVMDHPHTSGGDMLSVGVDAAGGYGGFTFCAAYTYGQQRNGDIALGFDDTTSHCWCLQAGYLFCGTAWEIAARYSSLEMEMKGMMPMTLGAHEIAFAVNYFIDGHADKLTADVSFLSGDEDGNEFADVYAGYQPTLKDSAVMLRFQWQLAL